ncbi:MAG: T9SS type A sorting domain-containing protein [Ignavibacteriales bacterium]|nr:T9SS type A sorting domain-containing protein [Ignavibacteriales bacterium]
MRRKFTSAQLIILLLISLFCIDVQSQSLPDSIEYNTADIDVGETFYTGYFTSFSHWAINSFIEDVDGILHVAYVDNYELYYFKSTDDGQTWQKEQIITGHEGDIRNASLALDLNGKVFIGLTAHSLYNYSNPTGINFGQEFYYDLYCINNKTGSWAVEQVELHSSGNYGPIIENIYVDSNNDVHLFANRYGWNLQGGEAWEWVRYSSSDTWSPRSTIVEFTDAGIDRGIYDKYIILADSSGKLCLIAARNKSDGPKLFYLLNNGSGWGSPVQLSDNIAVAWNRYDAVLDPDYNSYVVYFYNNSSNLPELRVSKNLGTPQNANINLPATDTLNYFTLHCTSQKILTMYLWTKNIITKLHVTFSYDGLNWTDPIEIPDNLKNYFGGLMVRTDTRQDYFISRTKQIVAVAGNRASQPYGPDTLFYGDIKLEPLTSVNTLLYLPNNYSLHQNYPNPFNPATIISFSLPELSYVELKVYNILGIEVTTVVNRELSQGNYNYNFDGSSLSSGVYFYTLKTNNFNQTKKMILLR